MNGHLALIVSQESVRTAKAASGIKRKEEDENSATLSRMQMAEEDQ